jgi:hypothetical protein
MAFTNPWSNIIPAGSDPANTADDEIRQLRLDIDERMDQIVPDWSADPLFVLTGIRKTIFWTDGIQDPGASDSSLTEGYGGLSLAVPGALTPAALLDSMIWRIRIPLPVGATLQLVDARVFRNQAASAISFGVNRITETPSRTPIAGAASASTAGWQTLNDSAIAEVLAQDELFEFQISMTADTTTDSVRFWLFHYEYDIPAALTGVVG